MKKMTYDGWDLNRGIYPVKGFSNNGVVEIVVKELAPSMNVVYYKKKDINLFYFRHGTICWKSINWSGSINIYKVFKYVFETIKKYIKYNDIQGRCGFELSGFKKLDDVIEYMLNRNGFETEIEDGFLLVKKHFDEKE